MATKKHLDDCGGLMTPKLIPRLKGDKDPKKTTTPAKKKVKRK